MRLEHRLKCFFNDLKANSPKEYDELDSYTETLKDHGRIEERTYRILADREDISKILDSKWEHVVCIGEARLKRIRNNEVSEEIHYHLMSCEMPAEKYGRPAREHWEIENKLHWILDIHFKEDASTANSGNSISNLALLRKIAFNLTKLDEEIKKKTTKKIMIDFMTDIELFKKLVFEVIPSKA